MLEHSLFGYGDVKTHTSRYPAKEITELVGPNSGDWAVMTTTVAGDHKIYALAHRCRGAVHTYISSHGQSITGKPQAHTRTTSTHSACAPALALAQRSLMTGLCPEQPQIDKRNPALSEGAPPRGAHAGDDFIVGGVPPGRTLELQARSQWGSLAARKCLTSKKKSLSPKTAMYATR